jgi:hypothetical protein
MNHKHFGRGPLGRLLHLALLGVAILLLGPIALGLVAVALGVVLAVAAPVLPFVIVGGLAYGPYLLVRRMLGHRGPVLTPQVRKAFPEIPPLRPRSAVALIERPVAPRPERNMRVVVKRVVGEVLSGALVGGLLGAVTVVGFSDVWQTSALISYCSLGAGIGAVVGFVVGGPRPARVEKTPAVG